MRKINNFDAKTSQALIKEYIASDSVFQIDNSTNFSDVNYCIDIYGRENFKKMSAILTSNGFISLLVA